MIISSDISRALDCQGFALFRASSKTQATVVIKQLGEVILETEVRIRRNPRTYLSSFEAVPFHNDHPRVRYIAWYCVEQDMERGSSVLVDMQKIVSHLSQAHRDELSRIYMRCPELRSIIPSSDYPLYQQDTGQIFWVPWLFPESISSFGKELIHQILEETKLTSNHIEVPLRPGEVLVVDNHRLVHGREAIARDSQRNLMRYWLCKSA